MEQEFAPLPTHNAKTAYGLLNAIARVITEEPKRLDMSVVCYRKERLLRDAITDLEWNKIKIPACGTVGCIAGWALVLTGLTSESTAIGNETWMAEMVLGLTPNQGKELFFPPALIGGSERQTVKHVNDTVKHIRKFQRANKAQLQNTKLLPNSRLF